MKRKSMEEACEECGTTHDFIIRYIEEQWVSPLMPEGFDDEDVARIRLIQELRVEFGVNDEGIPIILHLIDQLNLVRLQLRQRLSVADLDIGRQIRSPS